MLGFLGMHPVCEVEPLLRHMLENGGDAGIHVGNEFRMLIYDPFWHRPRRLLPWPLSMLQPHLCTLRVYDAALHKRASEAWNVSDAQRALKHEAEYDHSRFSEAIRDFLRDADPYEAVNINE